MSRPCLLFALTARGLLPAYPQAVTYRNTLFNVLGIGGQLQFRTAENTETVDAARASLPN